MLFLRLGTWVLRYPSSLMSLCNSAFFLVFTSSSSTASAFLFVLLEFLSFAPPWLCLAISFLQFFFLWSPSGRFGVCLPWLLSLPSQCVTLLSLCMGAWSACLVFQALCLLPWFPFLSSFSSLGALPTRSNLRYTTRRGLPLGRVSSWFSLLALLVHWSSHA